MELTIPGYEVHECIGAGGMARVYRATHLRLDRDVAIKVMLPRLAVDSEFSERFLREARIAANLNHPNIVQIYDVGEVDDAPFLSMEYVPDGGLNTRIGATHDSEWIAGVVKQLASALDYAHAAGFVHRDIKPANILFRDNGSLALSDFGIARAMHSDTNITQTGMVVGTPSYMSPEQAQGHPLTGQSDLYSLAVIAYQLVAGELPYQGDSSLSVAIKHISEPVPTIPLEVPLLQAFFQQALAKKPSERFANGEALSLALENALRSVDLLALQSTLRASMPQVNATQLSLTDNMTTAKVEPEKHLPAPDNHAATEIRDGDEKRGFQRTVEMVFVQINRFVIHIFHPEHKARGLLFTGIALSALLAYGIFLHTQSREVTPLSPGQQARLSQLLAGAEHDVRENKLMSPPGGNAYEKYLAILALSPEDPVAVSGIHTIGEALEKQTKEAVERGDFTQASQTLAHIKTLGQEKRYSALSNTLNEALKLRDAKAEIVWQEAKRKESSQQYSEAVDSYKTLLDGPKKKEAIAALDALGQRLHREALTLKRENRFQPAGQKIATALAATQDPVLQQTLNETRVAINTSQRQFEQARRIQTFMSQAEKAKQARSLTMPQGASAYDYYRKVLSIDATHAGAKTGIKNIEASLTTFAKTHITNSQLDNAQSNIAALKRVNPRHQDLRELERLLERAQKNQTRIDTLYKRAQIYLDRGRPRSAEKLYSDIERLSPGNNGLQALGVKIADAYVPLAQRELDARDWSDVDVWVKRGLRFVPKHSELLELRAQAKEKMER